MKTKKILLIVPFLFMIIGTGGCEKNNNLPQKGKVVFYTNAQAMLNCGIFNVDIYINNDSVGSIIESYTSDSYPDCVNSTMTVAVEKKIGKYNYVAKIDCGQYGVWTGEFDIVPDSCTYIFLDIKNCNLK